MSENATIPPMTLPFATPEFAGIGGVIKQRNSDFVVREIPLYEASGEGEHLYVEVEKDGLTTFEAVERLGKALHVPQVDIGYAGMKDARAVTRQTISIRGVTEDDLSKVQIAGLKVVGLDRHVNKLRLGHLKGNRFIIKIREVEATAVTKIAPVLKLLEQRGVPNYFGEQRFGRRNNNDLMGAALVRQDNRELAHLLLGNPLKGIDDGMQFKARKLYDEGDLEGSMKAWPRRNGLERRLLHRVIKTGKASGAGRALDEKLRRLFVSALQSRVFNAVLAKRLESYDRIIEGDWAYKTENGACFHVEDVAAEQPRAENWEISPTGPLIGFRVSLSDKAAGEIEQAVLSEWKLTPEMFKVPGHHRVKGARRPLRIRPEELEYAGGVDEAGAYVQLSFTLPAGAFATVLLREIMKVDEAEAPRVEMEQEKTGEEGPEERDDSAAHPLGATESIDDLDEED